MRPRPTIVVLLLVLALSAATSLSLISDPADAGAVESVSDLQMEVNDRVPVDGFADARTYLDGLPGGTEIRLEVVSHLPSMGWVPWDGSTSAVIEIGREALSAEYRYQGEDTSNVDRLEFLIAHEWAHVMQAREFGFGAEERVLLPTQVWGLYQDDGATGFEVHADCVAERITGMPVGYYKSGCTEQQLEEALALINMEEPDVS